MRTNLVAASVVLLSLANLWLLARVAKLEQRIKKLERRAGLRWHIGERDHG